MNKNRTFFSNMIKVLVLVIVSILVGGGSKVFAAEAGHGMPMHGRTHLPDSICQAYCNSTTTAIPAQAKRDLKEQAVTPNSDEPLWPQPSLFEVSVVKKLKNAVDSERLLRPPDIFALNCIYRF